jgi:hypothetical protein
MPIFKEANKEENLFSKHNSVFGLGFTKQDSLFSTVHNFGTCNKMFEYKRNPQNAQKSREAETNRCGSLQ